MINIPAFFVFTKIADPKYYFLQLSKAFQQFEQLFRKSILVFIKPFHEVIRTKTT